MTPTDMSDYMFMWTGGNTKRGHLDVPEAYLTRALALISTWAVEAFKDAGTYCEHAGRNVVTITDVNMSMKHQAMTFLHMPDLESRVLGTEQELSEVVDESSSEDESDSEPDVPWTISTCNCNVCVSLNEAPERFARWEPTDSAEIVMKRSLEAFNTI